MNEEARALRAKALEAERMAATQPSLEGSRRRRQASERALQKSLARRRNN